MYCNNPAVCRQTDLPPALCVQETMRWRLTLDQFGILAQVLARHGLIADVREALEYFAEAK